MGNKMNIVSKSKFLSLVLRHQPEKIGIKLDDNGFVSVDILLAALEKADSDWNLSLLEKVVADNNKKRFEFKEINCQHKIRARQGHSVDVDLGYKEFSPPARLYHGTNHDAVSAILKTGLQKMSRHHVHLSQDVATAISVGSRKGLVAVLEIDSYAMSKCGYAFYKTDNEVWLTDFVPSEFIAVYKNKYG